MYATATDPNADIGTKQAALAKYNAIHQWTGDGYEDKGGVTRNTRTGNPAIGTAATQLSPQSYAQLMKDAWSPQPVPQDNGTVKWTPTWQVAKAASAEDYVSRSANAAPSPTSGAPASAGSSTPARALAAPSAAPPARAAAPSKSADPYLDKALSDGSYDIKTPPVRSGISATPAALEQQKVTVDSRTHLLKDSQDATTASATALQYLKAAKSIMDSKGATVGAYGGLLTQASRALGGGPQSQNYQELAKYLVNAAVQSGKANFPNATQSEVGLQLNELSANKDMDAPTINDILDTNIRNSQYTLDTAKRANTYLDKGKDPQKFATWNQQYYPREKIVNTPTEGAVPVKSAAEARKLPSGTVFITPDGRRKVVP